MAKFNIRLMLYHKSRFQDLLKFSKSRKSRLTKFLRQDLLKFRGENK